MAASCRSTCCSPRDPSRARWLHGDAQPGAAHRGEARRAEGRPRLRATFLLDGKPPAAGAMLRQPALAATLDHLAHAGLDDFYRGDVGREIAADLERIGSPVTRADLEDYRRDRRRAAERRDRRRHALQYAAADAGPGLADHPGAVRAAARHAKAEASTHPRPGRGDQARLPRARPRHHRSRSDAAAARSLPRCRIPRRRSAKIDRRKAGRWPAPLGRGDTIWMGAADASGLVVSYIQSLYWEFGSGCVLPRDRRADAEPRRELLARPEGAERARARPAAVPHAQSGARVLATGGSWPTAPWAATASRRPRRRCSPAMCCFASRSTRRSTRRAGCSAAPGARRTPTCGWSRASTAISIDRLLSAGHDVEVLDEPYSDTMGHAGAVVLHPDGTLEGAHDPRADGGAAEVIARFRLPGIARHCLARLVTAFRPNIARHLLPHTCDQVRRIAGPFSATAFSWSRPLRLAHPHVWVTMKSEVVYAPDGTITGIVTPGPSTTCSRPSRRRASTAKKKGEFTREELKPLAKTNVESLKEFDYFTYARRTARRRSSSIPRDYYLEYKDSVLTLNFTLPLKTPVKAKRLRSRSTTRLFVDFSFAEGQSGGAEGAPAVCKLAWRGRTRWTGEGRQAVPDRASKDDVEQLRRAIRQPIAVTCP